MKSIFLYAYGETSQRALVEIYSMNSGEFWNVLQLKNVKEWNYNLDSLTFSATIKTGGEITIKPKAVNTSSGKAAGFLFDLSQVKTSEMDSEFDIAGRLRGVIQQKLKNYPPEVQITTGLVE